MAEKQKQPAAHHYLQNIPGINMTLAANDPNIKTIKQHYYPEGGWGWIILGIASFSHFVTSALTPAIGLVIIEMMKKFSPEQGVAAAVLIGALSTSVTLLVSPVVISVCRRKSNRLMAILGGLVAGLGCLFTSFATQFHQLFFSMGIIIGVGNAMIRDPAVIMVGQYFKKKRELVEMVVVCSQGLGISFTPLLLTYCIRAKSWRFGFQVMAVLISLSFFLGVLYRPASLYHPQRRAILHLKSLQKRSRLKDQHLKTATAQQASFGSNATTATATAASAPKNNNPKKSQTGKEPYFDFSVLKSRTVQIILSGTCLSHFGLTAPLFIMGIQGGSEGIEHSSLMRLQLYLGLGMIVGVATFGLIIIKNSMECMISRQYLCQTSSFILSATLVTLTRFSDYDSYLIFVWIYGFFLGAYHYSIKMFLYEKVRSRNFNRAWGFLQMSASISILAGVPITTLLNEHLGGKCGFYASSLCVALGSAVLFLIDAHKKSHARRIDRIHKRASFSSA